MRLRYPTTRHLLSWVLLLSSGVYSGAQAEENLSPLPSDADVARAGFTTEIIAREPADQIVILREPANEVYYFTDLRNMEGRTITHQWEFDGKVVSEVAFDVAGPRWRVHSKKALDASMLGTWTVIVRDESGWPLHATLFEYEAPAH